MDTIDVCKYEERAAILEYEAGLSRFQAETLAAQEQGVQRWRANKCAAEAKFSQGQGLPSGGNTARNGQSAQNAHTQGKRKATHA